MAAHPADAPIALLPAAGRRIAGPVRSIGHGAARTLSVTWAALRPYALIVAAFTCFTIGGFLQWGSASLLAWSVPGGGLLLLELLVSLARTERSRAG